MRTWRILTCLALTLLFAAGCREARREYTLNPDGSGKVVYIVKTLIPAAIVQKGENRRQTPEQMARKAASQLLENMKGVDTWKGLVFRIAEDGRFEFEGTAYFRDFNELNLDTSTEPSYRNALDTSTPGRVTLRMASRPEPAEAAAREAPAELSEEEVRDRIRVEKAKINETLMLMTAFLQGWKEEDIFLLPGTVGTVKGFSRDGNRVSLAFKGEEMLAAFKKLSEDEEFLQRTVIAGEEPFKENQDELAKMIFGSAPPYEATAEGGAAQFDYEAEATEARAAYPAMMVGLGFSPEKPPFRPAGEAGTEPFPKIRELKVGAITYVLESDGERGILPRFEEKGLYLELIGELDGPIEEIEKFEVTEASCEDGTSLLRDGVSSGWPRLSRDKRAVLLPVPLVLPKPGIGSLRKISGSLTFSFDSRPRTHELGLLALQAGAKGKALNAVITGVSASPDEPGEKAVELKFEIANGKMRGLEVFDENHGKLDTRIKAQTTSCFDDGCDVEIVFTGKLPERAALVVETREDECRVTLPWTLENIPVGAVP